MPWSITFIPIWLFFSGFLCAPCFQWVFKEKKAHMLFFLIVCFIWIPTVISSILLAYKLDHDDKDAMKLRYVFVQFWVLDSIICFLYIIFTIYAIYKESKSNQDADNYQDVVNYFEKKHKAKINLNINNDLNLEDYMIEFKSKTKKVLDKIEKVEKLEAIRIDNKKEDNIIQSKSRKIFKKRKFKKNFYKKKTK